MKVDMSCKQVPVTEENIILLKDLRFKAYDPHFKSHTKDIDLTLQTYYEICIRKGSILPFGLYIGNKLVGGCYISTMLDSLYIEQLFIHPELQGRKLKLGRLLLKYVLTQKELIEDHFNTKLEKSMLEPSCDKVGELYEEEGYNYGPNRFFMRKKI